MPISVRDTLFALDAPVDGKLSARAFLKTPMFPVWPDGSISLLKLGQRFGSAGTALRALAAASTNVWKHMDRATLVKEIRERLRDPMIMYQNPTGLCGPLAVVMELARRAPARYVLAAKELLETGKLTCPTGRIIEAEEELREEPVPDLVSDEFLEIGQVDWLLAATMRDDENIWEDVDDDANGLESMTFWGEMRDWTRDVLDLPGGGWETCFVSGEIDCMKKAQAAVNAGGVAFFLVDVCLLRDGGSDDEEEMFWQRRLHVAGGDLGDFESKKHSEDDAFPPDHWIGYLGGLSLGSDPDDDDPVTIRLWSWAGEYTVTGTVDAFTEYLYGVVTGTK